MYRLFPDQRRLGFKTEAGRPGKVEKIVARKIMRTFYFRSMNLPLQGADTVFSDS